MENQKIEKKKHELTGTVGTVPVYVPKVKCHESGHDSTALAFGT